MTRSTLAMPQGICAVNNRSLFHQELAKLLFEQPPYTSIFHDVADVLVIGYVYRKYRKVKGTSKPDLITRLHVCAVEPTPGMIALLVGTGYPARMTSRVSYRDWEISQAQAACRLELEQYDPKAHAIFWLPSREERARRRAVFQPDYHLIKYLSCREVLAELHHRVDLIQQLEPETLARLFTSIQA